MLSKKIERFYLARRDKSILDYQERARKEERSGNSGFLSFVAF